MCGRFSLSKPPDAITQHFQLDAAQAAKLTGPRYNIAPTQTIPVVRWNPETGGRELALQRWGLIPPWMKDPRAGPPLLNARAETLASKPAFRHAFRSRRCLIPADGFYEWQVVGRGKQPWHIHFRNHGLFAFAGLWEQWRGEAGEAPVESCTIITTTPIARLAPIHDRMPAIAASGDYAAWLDPGYGDPAGLAAMLRPPEDLDLEMVAVSTLVNRTSHDGPDCCRPVATAEARLPVS